MKSIIIYATKYGSVERAANILKLKLNDEVPLVNIKKQPIPPLDDYETVILGGSIYIGKIQRELTNYINTNLPLLLKKRVGLFICAAQPEPVCTQELKDSFPVELFNNAVAKEVFGYEFNYETYNLLDKLIIRKIKGVKENCSELSEEKIEAFGSNIKSL